MKLVNAIRNTLEILFFILLIGGGLLVIGSVGAFEEDNISFVQLIVQEFIAGLSIYLSLVVVAIRENVTKKYMRQTIKTQKRGN